MITRLVTTTKGTTTIMNGTSMKIGHIACGPEIIIADITIFPTSKTTIENHTGAGGTSILTPCSRLIYASSAWQSFTSLNLQDLAGNVTSSWP